MDQDYAYRILEMFVRARANCVTFCEKHDTSCARYNIFQTTRYLFTVTNLNFQLFFHSSASINMSSMCRSGRPLEFRGKVWTIFGGAR